MSFEISHFLTLQWWYHRSQTKGFGTNLVTSEGIHNSLDIHVDLLVQESYTTVKRNCADHLKGSSVHLQWMVVLGSRAEGFGNFLGLNFTAQLRLTWAFFTWPGCNHSKEKGCRLSTATAKLQVWISAQKTQSGFKTLGVLLVLVRRLFSGSHILGSQSDFCN